MPDRDESVERIDCSVFDLQPVISAGGLLFFKNIIKIKVYYQIFVARPSVRLDRYGKKPLHWEDAGAAKWRAWDLRLFKINTRS
jgi:hypothetical protein